MWIHLRFVGAYSLITGKKKDSINVTRGITIGGLLDRLTEKYGSSFHDRVRDRNGSLRSNCRLFFGQEDVSRLGLDTPIKEGEDVALYFLIGAAGG